MRCGTLPITNRVSTVCVCLGVMCICMCLTTRGKLDAKAVARMFVGYDRDGLGWRVLDVSTKKVQVSRDVVFDEGKFTQCARLAEEGDNEGSGGDNDTSFYKQWDAMVDDNELRLAKIISLEEQASESARSDEPEVEVDGMENKGDDERDGGDESAEEEEEAEPGSVRTATNGKNRQPPIRYGIVDPRDVGALSAGTVSVDEDSDPRSFAEAMTSRDRAKWIQAVHEEIRSLEAHATWRVDRLPPGEKAIGTKWVFKRKLASCNRVYFCYWIYEGA